MVRDIPTRSIRRAVERELWGRAAGRCEFPGCNRLLYKSPVTQEPVNLSEKAHIFSFSEGGPRGWGPFARSPDGINDVANLLLVCHDCHKTIDQDIDGTRYPATLLSKWKQQHEIRVCVVAGISPSRQSHVVLYGGRIGQQGSPLQPETAIQAMFPEWFPAEERPVALSMLSEQEDKSPLFWQSESDHLRSAFERHVAPRIREANPSHFSVFGIANQPLLILLGTLLTDKIPTEVYQLHREPTSWAWQVQPDATSFRVISPERPHGMPALILSLSGRIHRDRVAAVLGSDISLWELTVDDCHNDFLKSRNQLSAFRTAARRLIVEIAQMHGQTTPLNIFPAMPVACAIELGRVRMPKADMPWIIFDQNNKLGGFIKALEIGGNNE